MEPELRKAMSMLPRLDCTDPVAARSEMNRFVRLSTLLGLHSLTDPEIDVVDRICPCDGDSAIPVRLYVPRDLVKPAAARVRNTRIRMAAAGHYIQDLQYRYLRTLLESFLVERSELRPLARIAVATSAT